jgi:WASH complex subunit strumpellin
VDARQILHDGLRKELVRQVSAAMHATLVFKNDKTGQASVTQGEVRADFERTMKQLSKQMDGFRRSIEYIQDYVDMAGLKMWQEELARIVNYNIEQECNRYLKKKVLDHNSKYQSKVIPIPRFAVPTNAGAINSQAVNFMGRAMNCLLAMTDPSSTIYGPEAIAWFMADGTEVCGDKTFSLLHSGINVTGLAGLDRLLGFRVVHELGFFLRFYKDEVGFCHCCCCCWHAFEVCSPPICLSVRGAWALAHTHSIQLHALPPFFSPLNMPSAVFSCR